MAGIGQLDPKIFPGHPAMLEVLGPEGLLSAAQMNVIEFHTWNGVKTAILKPDRMTFDIDPGEGVNWGQIQEAARLVVGLQASTPITTTHALVRWDMPRLLTTLLDSPEHLTR